MPKHPKAVREPVQVYLTRDEKALLDRLSAETGISRAEILRRGLREFGLRHRGESPMLQYLNESVSAPWPEGGSAEGHDEALAREYRYDTPADSE